MPNDRVENITYRAAQGMWAARLNAIPIIPPEYRCFTLGTASRRAARRYTESIFPKMKREHLFRKACALMNQNRATQSAFLASLKK